MKTSALSPTQRRKVLLRDLALDPDDEKAHKRLIKNAFPLFDMPVGSLVICFNNQRTDQITAHSPAPADCPELGDRVTIGNIGVPAYWITQIVRKGPAPNA